MPDDPLMISLLQRIALQILRDRGEFVRGKELREQCIDTMLGDRPTLGEYLCLSLGFRKAARKYRMSSVSQPHFFQNMQYLEDHGLIEGEYQPIPDRSGRITPRIVRYYRINSEGRRLIRDIEEKRSNEFPIYLPGYVQSVSVAVSDAPSP